MNFHLLVLLSASSMIVPGRGKMWGWDHSHFDDVSEEIEEEEGMSWEYVSSQIEQVHSHSLGEEGGSMYNEEQCPCAKPNGASACAPYNPKYQALTFEEATNNFRDTVCDPDKSKTLLEEVGEDEEEESEESHECPYQQQTAKPKVKKTKKPQKGCCQRFLTHMVRWANGLGDEMMRNKTLREAQRMRKWCGVSMKNGDFRRTCKTFFTSTANDKSLKVELEPVDESDSETLMDIEKISNLLKGGVKGGRVMPGCEPYSHRPKKLKACQKKLERDARNKMKALQKEERRKERMESKRREMRDQNNWGYRRSKRQTTTFNSKAGDSYPVRCSYRKGGDMQDNSGFTGLCNLCWSWKTLPDRYFPSLINELSCDTSDTSCFSGYATCRPRYRNFDVLYNFGTETTPQWAKQSVSAVVACECQVITGSPLYRFASQ